MEESPKDTTSSSQRFGGILRCLGAIVEIVAIAILINGAVQLFSNDDLSTQQEDLEHVAKEKEAERQHELDMANVERAMTAALSGSPAAQKSVAAIPSVPTPPDGTELVTSVLCIGGVYGRLAPIIMCIRYDDDATTQNCNLVLTHEVQNDEGLFCSGPLRASPVEDRGQHSVLLTFQDRDKVAFGGMDLDLHVVMGHPTDITWFNGSQLGSPNVSDNGGWVFLATFLHGDVLVVGAPNELVEPQAIARVAEVETHATSRDADIEQQRMAVAGHRHHARQKRQNTVVAEDRPVSSTGRIMGLGMIDGGSDALWIAMASDTSTAAARSVVGSKPEKSPEKPKKHTK